MAQAIATFQYIASAPLRTRRFNDLKHLGTNMWRLLDDLVDQGVLARLAYGIYTAPPDGRSSKAWRPGLETAGLAIATARHGERSVALMGIGAARHWSAIPRAIGSTVIAVPTAGRRPIDTSSGRIHFVQRDLSQVDAVLEQTELGPALITTPEQTLFDLLMRPHQGGEVDSAHAAAQQIIPQVSPADFEEIIGSHSRINDAVREVAATIGASS